MSVALRHLTGDLHVTATTVQWLTSGFLLTMGVVIPTTGFLLQRFTPRRVFLAAMGLFIAGTLICALAPGFGVLLVGRVVQAFGTAVMLPLLMTTVMTLVPAARRGATMGTVSIVIAVAPAIGPTIGGLVLAALTWRWLFWCVLPLAVAAFVLGAAYLRGDAQTRPARLDVPSVMISTVGLGGIVYSFSTVATSVRGAGGAPLGVPLAALVVGAAAMTWFVARQLHRQRINRALLDLRPFLERTFTTSAALSGLMLCASSAPAPSCCRCICRMSCGPTPSPPAWRCCPAASYWACSDARSDDSSTASAPERWSFPARSRWLRRCGSSRCSDPESHSAP
jgi:DHA2 family lincomycin resistance protein-like MFS transporter